MTARGRPSGTSADAGNETSARLLARRLAVAFLLPLLALAVTLALEPHLERTPLALFLLAVVLTGWIGGFGPSLVASFVSVLAAGILLFPPSGSFMVGANDAVAVTMFGGVALLVSMITGSLHRTHRRAEAEAHRIAELLSRLEQAQQIGHLGSWEWDVVANRVIWSSELYRMYGFAPQDFEATLEAYLERVHPEDRERAQHVVETAVRTGQPFEFEERIIRPDGSQCVLLSRGRPVQDDAGNVVRLLGACRDITVEKAAEQRNLEIARMQAAQAAAERQSMELRNREARLEGALEQLEHTTVALRSSNEALSREASERLRAEQSLRESEARLTAFLEQVPLALGMLDAGGNWVIRNRALERFMREAIPSMDSEAMPRWRSFDASGAAIDPSQWPAARALRGETVTDMEFVFTDHDDGERWTRVSAAPFRDRSDAVVGAIAVIEDIDERKRAAERAESVNRIAQAMLRHGTLDEVLDELLEQVLGVFAADEAAVLLNGVDGTDLIVRSARGIDPRARSLRIPLGAGVAGRVAASGRSLIIPDLSEVEVVNPYLRAAVQSLVAVPLVVKDAVLGVLHVGTTARRDFGPSDVALLEMVAERVASILERARLSDAERSARAEADIARQEAQAANHAKAEVLAMVSHDLRTPLNAIAGYAELLMMGIHGSLTEQQREVVARIKHGERRMAALLLDLVSFARMEAGQIGNVITSVPVHDLLDALEAEVAPQLRQKGLFYVYQPCDPGLAILADRPKLEQVLLNLLTNAIKFTDDGGRITLRVVPAQEYVAIRVRDTGHGIPREKLARVFEPFVQAGGADGPQHAGGVGLGLAIARGLTRSMGGDVIVRSVPGQGSVFTVRLRRAVAVGSAGQNGVQACEAVTRTPRFHFTGPRPP